tara:strand:+ start:1167 stop:1688 length:522 start_codon:yes stop_codon:yes gene_type:complete
MKKNTKCFDFYTIGIDEHPYITKPLTSEQLRIGSLLKFNVDGFNLTPLERLHHLNSGIDINQNPNRAAAAQEWIYDDVDMAPLYVDYSFIYTRYAYAGDAREQIRMYSKTNPEIKQLLNIRPRYGISFNICYMNAKEFKSIIKINSSCRTFNEIYKEKKHWETYLKDTNLLSK